MDGGQQRSLQGGHYIHIRQQRRKWHKDFRPKTGPSDPRNELILRRRLQEGG
jgi:hypothetical protein